MHKTVLEEKKAMFFLCPGLFLVKVQIDPLILSNDSLYLFDDCECSIVFQPILLLPLFL